LTSYKWLCNKGLMQEKNCKKSFYITPELAKEWEEFHKPSKDYSPSAAAGMLFYLIADHPNLRESFRKLAADSNIKSAKKKAKEILVDSILNAEILKEIDSLGTAKTEFLRLLRQAKEQSG